MPKPPKRFSSQFKQRIPQIAESLDNGYTHAEIIEQLAESGFVINPATYRTYTNRFAALLNKERQNRNLQKPMQKQNAPKIKSVASAEEDDEPMNKSDPRIFKKILDNPISVESLEKLAKGKK